MIKELFFFIKKMFEFVCELNEPIAKVRCSLVVKLKLHLLTTNAVAWRSLDVE